ncbi:MAG: PadR family transcriptional regulator [Roseiflexaceae bacterium]
MYSEIVILAMLHQRPQHGYELKKCIELALSGTVSLNNNVLYPALKHFEAMGAVMRQVVPQEGKPNRHIYSLTAYGIELLHTYLCDFPPDQAANEAEFFTRVAFFDYLSLDERQEILQKRLAHLAKQLAYLHNLQQLADAACASVDAQQRVLAFHIGQIGNEHQWIATWLEEMRASM